MGNSLEERLQAHSDAFDGLLSLIPAKYYYDGDTSTQWQQKRKSKEELKNNKRQKLDPTLTKNATAKDVLKEAEKTATPVILPGQKLEAKLQQKKAKGDEEGEEEDDDDDGSIGYGSEELGISDIEDESKDTKEKPHKGKDGNEELIKDKVTIVFDDNGDFIEGEEKVEHNKLMNQVSAKGKNKKPLTEEEQNEKKKNMTELRSKLQEKILNLKEKRKAPGTKVQGAATSRQQILEERRKKQELRKEMLKKKRETGEVTDDDSSSDDEEDEDKTETSNVMFGNIEFMDGEKISSDLTAVRKVGKKKGPSNNDIKGHLKKIEKDKLRLDQMDKDSRDKFEEKNKWKRALASVQGDKLKDDEKLLKKALRRKESQKRKSEREWKERKQTVADHIRKKQERREENLKIRKDNRGKGRQQQTKQLSSYKMGRSKKASDGKGAKRAGFEGGMKSGKGKNDK